MVTGCGGRSRMVAPRGVAGSDDIVYRIAGWRGNAQPSTIPDPRPATPCQHDFTTPKQRHDGHFGSELSISPPPPSLSNRKKLQHFSDLPALQRRQTSERTSERTIRPDGHSIPPQSQITNIPTLHAREYNSVTEAEEQPLRLRLVHSTTLSTPGRLAEGVDPYPHTHPDSR